MNKTNISTIACMTSVVAFAAMIASAAQPDAQKSVPSDVPRRVALVVQNHAAATAEP